MSVGNDKENNRRVMITDAMLADLRRRVEAKGNPSPDALMHAAFHYSKRQGQPRTGLGDSTIYKILKGKQKTIYLEQWAILHAGLDDIRQAWKRSRFTGMPKAMARGVSAREIDRRQRSFVASGSHPCGPS